MVLDDQTPPVCHQSLPANQMISIGDVQELEVPCLDGHDGSERPEMDSVVNKGPTKGYKMIWMDNGNPNKIEKTF